MISFNTLRQTSISSLLESVIADYYHYFGWITPSGDFLAPKNINDSHYDIIRTLFKTPGDAFKSGYIKVICETYYNGSIHFDSDWEYASKNISQFVASVVTGLKKIEEMITSGEMGVIFNADFIPLPQSLVFIFDSYTIIVKKYKSPAQAGKVLESALKERKVFLNERVIQKGGKYYLYSKDGSRKLGGPYRTKEQANKRERQVQFFKHLSKRLNEVYLPQKYYYYYGWITPSGKLILPEDKTQSHIDLLPKRYSSEIEAMDDGYIRFLSEKGEIYFESSLSAFRFIRLGMFIKIITDGIKNIENGIISGEFERIFKEEDIPLPEKGYVDFFPHNLNVYARGSLEFLPQLTAIKLKEFLTKNKMIQMSEAKAGRRVFDPDWFPSKFYFYYGLITPEGDVILPTSIEDQPTHAHIIAALGFDSSRKAMKNGYVRFLVEKDHPMNISLETTHAYIENVGGAVAAEILLRGVRKIEEMIMSGKIADKFDLERVPLPRHVNVYIDETSSRINIPIENLRETLRVMFFESFMEGSMFSEYYLYFGWFNPDGEILFPKDPIKDIHYTIIQDIFPTPKRAIENGWIRFISEYRWAGRHILQLESSLRYVKKVGVQNFISYLKRGIKKIEEMIMNGELKNRFFDRMIPLPTEYAIYIHETDGEVKGPENLFYSMLSAKLRKELEIDK
ncbi:MAG: hypothetical protein N3A54_05300 [Patescibacteria group bacterium]|nr:hypothetical protein [Patescibacteria group bacterium]